MSTKVFHGMHAVTIGALKPAGRIRIGDETFDACSDGTWIDDAAKVVVIGRRSQSLLVSEAEHDVPENLGDEIVLKEFARTAPMESPPAFVERINSVVAGGLLGCVVGAILVANGRPVTVSVLALPVSGHICGLLFKAFVKTAVDSTGPYVDHRPMAIWIAFLTVIGTAVGAFVGAGTQGPFIGSAWGMPCGCFAGGAMAWLGQILVEGP